MYLILNAFISCKQSTHNQSIVVEPLPTVIDTAHTDIVLKDIDGNTYKTVKIGNQIWMAENLRVSKYRNGEPITLLNDNTVSQIKEGEGAWNYANGDSGDSSYGKLYNWYAVNDARNIAPKGWHVPTETEYLELFKYCEYHYSSASASGARAIMANSDLWYNNKYYQDGFVSKSGFEALPAGESSHDYRHVSYNFEGDDAYFWTADKFTDDSAKYFGIEWRGSFLISDNKLNTQYKLHGMSLRLIKDKI
jgi:uncharacterized protein (TIGR02145 family)